MPPEPGIASRDVRDIIEQVRAWHEACLKTWRQLVFVHRKDGKADLVIGVGDRRGLYVGCSYGWDIGGCFDLIAVAPGGFTGRRTVVEYNYDGNPFETFTQCLLPFDLAHHIIEEFLHAPDALPLCVEWISETGLRWTHIRRKRT